MCGALRRDGSGKGAPLVFVARTSLTPAPALVKLPFAMGRVDLTAMEHPGSVALSRLVWFVLMATPLAVLITAASLTPDPAGHGTHTQLGLPPCGFLTVTGYPCPGCGLTTSFAHMIRLQVVGAARANPFGVPLFLVSLVTIPVAAMGLRRGWSVLDTLERFRAERVAIMLSLCSIVVWLVKIFTRVAALSQ